MTMVLLAIAMAMAMAMAMTMAMAMVVAMAMAMAMAMLEMDDNGKSWIRTRCQLSCFNVLRLSSQHMFVYFSNYWEANDRKRKRFKGSKIQTCHIAQFTKLG